MGQERLDRGNPFGHALVEICVRNLNDEIIRQLHTYRSNVLRTHLDQKKILIGNCLDICYLEPGKRVRLGRAELFSRQSELKTEH